MKLDKLEKKTKIYQSFVKKRNKRQLKKQERNKRVNKTKLYKT